MVTASEFLKIQPVPEIDTCTLMESYLVYSLLSISDSVVEPDGSSFICRGREFTGIHDSDDYAYGDTESEAVINYVRLRLNINN